MAFYDNGMGKIGLSAKTCTIVQADGNTFFIPLADIFVLSHDFAQARLMVGVRGMPQPLCFATKNASSIQFALKGRLLALHGPFDKDPDNGDKLGGNATIHLVT